MRVLLLFLSLALAAGALADDKRKHKPVSVTKEIDKATPLMTQDNTGGPGDSATAADAKEKANKTKSRAQDYNSSRSNTTSLMGGPQGDATDFGLSRSSERSEGQQGDSASDGKRSAGLHAEGAVHRDVGNESRCSMGRLDDDCDDDSVPTTDGDYNSSRSNNINGAADAGPGGDDRVVRKKPGR